MDMNETTPTMEMSISEANSVVYWKHYKGLSYRQLAFMFINTYRMNSTGCAPYSFNERYGQALVLRAISLLKTLER